MLEIIVKGDNGEGKTTVATIIKNILEYHGYDVSADEPKAIQACEVALYGVGKPLALRPKSVSIKSK